MRQGLTLNGGRYQDNFAHIRQPRPDCGLSSEVKLLKTYQVVPSWLGSERSAPGKLEERILRPGRNPRAERNWYSVAEQPAPALHLAHPEECAAPTHCARHCAPCQPQSTSPTELPPPRPTAPHARKQHAEDQYHRHAVPQHCERVSQNSDPSREGPTLSHRMYELNVLRESPPPQHRQVIV